MVTKSTNVHLERILALCEKIENNAASQEEKNEYMLLLCQSGYLVEESYAWYISGRNADMLLDNALIMGGALSCEYMLDEAFGK